MVFVGDAGDTDDIGWAISRSLVHLLTCSLGQLVNCPVAHLIDERVNGSINRLPNDVVVRRQYSKPKKADETHENNAVTMITRGCASTRPNKARTFSVAALVAALPAVPPHAVLLLATVNALIFVSARVVLGLRSAATKPFFRRLGIEIQTRQQVRASLVLSAARSRKIAVRNKELGFELGIFQTL